MTKDEYDKHIKAQNEIIVDLQRKRFASKTAEEAEEWMIQVQNALRDLKFIKTFDPNKRND